MLRSTSPFGAVCAVVLFTLGAGCDPYSPDVIDANITSGQATPSAPDCAIHIAGNGWSLCEGSSNCMEYDVGSIPIDTKMGIPHIQISSDCSKVIFISMPEYASPECAASIGGECDSSSPVVKFDPEAYTKLEPLLMPLDVQAHQEGDFTVQCDLHDENDPYVGHAILKVKGSGYLQDAGK